MYVVFSEISVVGKPVADEELDAMFDNNFGRNGCIANDKWLWGTQFALCEDEYPELDELEFRQLVYKGVDARGQQLVIDNLPEEWASDESEGETPLYKRLRSELGLPEGDHNRLHIVYNALVYPMAEDSYWDNFEAMYDGLYEGEFVRSSWGDLGEVRVEEQEDPIDPDTLLGVVVTYRIAPIDEKYVKWVEYENEDGEKVREQRVDLEAYLTSDDFAAAEDDENYIDKWEYAAYGAMTTPPEEDDEPGAEADENQAKPITTERRNDMTIQELLEQAKADGAETRVLTDGITFVDATNADDPAQDGTAGHPFASIAQAVERAGEGGVIFVNGGEYDEEVALKPGQTLTSEIDLQGGERHASVEAPRIAPRRETMNHQSPELPYAGQPARAMIWMAENATLRRIRAGEPEAAVHGHGLWSVCVLPDPQSPDGASVVIEDCELPDGIAVRLERGTLGRLRIDGNTNLGLVDMECGEQARLDAIEARDNRFAWGGVRLTARGALGSLELHGNGVADGEGAVRFELTVMGQAETVALGGNDIACGSEGHCALSLAFVGPESRARQATLTDNSFLGGDEASGVDIELRAGARLGELRLERNTIETNTFDPEYEVAVLDARIGADAQLGSFLATGNSVTLYADYGDDEDDEDEAVERGERVAVRVQLEPGASVDSLEIAGNAIDLPDEDCADVLISGEPGQIGRKTVRDNRVSREEDDE